MDLRQTEDFRPGFVVYGRLRVPGEIFLHEQPLSEAASLRDFMRFDVLLHELGHHVLQHRSRKVGRVQRRSDHERFAEAFADRWKPTVQAVLETAADDQAT
ncbi:hypothetical protein ABZ949_06620 [Micromonospora tulbaghiae]|uniref:ImmA/IrrE family metallo-endopeptidase n=1 Tax=Micromonospora tulbaghiae TaxID=479978 RepID=UPI0033F26220